MSCLASLFGLLMLGALTGGGLYALVSAQAHGETLILPLTLLAVPLLVLGWIVVRVGTVFIRGWQWGRGGGQKALVGGLTAVLVGAGLVVAVQAMVPNQRPSPELTAALAGACRADAVAGAGALDTSGAHPNHLVVLDSVGHEHAWTGYPAIEWRPLVLSDAELVACISAAETRTEIEVCSYVNGPPIHRYRVSREVVFIEAATGRSLARLTISDDARRCGATEQKDVTELSGDLSWDMVARHAVSLVDRGVYVAPTAPTGEPWPSTPVGGPTPPAAETPPGQPTEPPVAQRVALAAAIEDGLLAATLRGDGLQNVVADLESSVDAPLLVTVAVGTMLEPSRSATQTMVVTIETEIELGPRESGSWDIPAACARMRKDEPGDNDRFTIRGEPATGDLLRLLRASEFSAADGRVQQFAVWTITNDPARNGYTGLTSMLDPLGSGPSDEDFAAIRALLMAAGIDPGGYRAFR